MRKSLLSLNKQKGLLALWGGSSGGSGPVVPSLPQSATVVARWSAQTLVQSDGSQVTSWVDSINGLTAVTGAGTATYQTNQFGGLPSVRLGGAADLTIDITGSALKTALASGNFSCLINFRVRGATSQGLLLSDNAGGSTFKIQADGTWAGLFAGGQNSVTAPTAGTGFNTLITTSTNTPIGTGTGVTRSALNGGIFFSTTSLQAFSGQNRLVLGNLTSGNFSFCNADIMDIVFWSTTLTPKDNFQATNYFFDATQYNQTKPWSLITYIFIPDGDSITSGAGAYGVNGAGIPFTPGYLAAQSIGLIYGQWSLVAIGGIQWSDIITKVPEWLGIGALLGVNLKVTCFEYINSNLNGQSAAQILASTVSYYGLVHANPNTTLAIGSNTSTAEDGTTGDPKRLAVCTAMALTPSTYGDAYIAYDQITQIGLNGVTGVNSFSVNGAGAGLDLYFDTLHPNKTGNGFLYPSMVTGVNAIAG